jgi:uncharacterized membrane protein YhaH (DUF805 family)
LEYFMPIWYILWLIAIFYGYLVYFMVNWSILWLFGLFYGYLVYFMVILYILWLFGIFLPVLACCSKRNLATLMSVQGWQGIEF